MLVGRNRTTCSSVFLEHGPSKVSLQTVGKSSLLSLLSTCSELFYLAILCTKQHLSAFSLFKLGFVLLFKEVLGTCDGHKVLSRVTGLEVKEDKARSFAWHFIGTLEKEARKEQHICKHGKQL